MIKKLFGKKKEDDASESAYAELIEKIQKMNLTEMRSYVNGRLDLELCEEGLLAIITKLTTYLSDDDMDSKKKKAFDLILLIAASKHISVGIVEAIQVFIQSNRLIIEDFDKKNKEIYQSRFNDAIDLAFKNMQEITALKNKMNLLGENDTKL